jgi:Holliday junction resolvase
MLESKIQTKIKKKLEADGWIVIKLIRTSKNGIPDLLAHRNGETIYIEVKQPNGDLSPLQIEIIKQIRSKGIKVYVWTDYNKNFEL